MIPASEGRELTKAGRIDDAKLVKGCRENLKP